MTDEKRKKRVLSLIQRLESGKDVARRDLRMAITADEWEGYEYCVTQYRQDKKMVSETPDRLKRYIARLKRADFYYMRAENMSGSRNATGTPIARARHNFYMKSESHYETAFEMLGEELDRDGDLHLWLDRPFDPETFSPLPTGVPRLRNSKSGCANSGSEGVLKQRRQSKLEALKGSLAELENPSRSTSASANVASQMQVIRDSLDRLALLKGKPRKKNDFSRFKV